jgi:DNA-directed RNA polymerase delta subunit
VEAKNLLSENKNKELPDYVNYVFTNTLKMDNMVRYNKCINEIKAFVDQFNADINEAYETFYQKVHILSIFLFIEQRHSFTTFITKQIFT